MEGPHTGYLPYKDKEKKMENQTQHALSDEAIGQIAKLLQLAMLTGTDIVDNLRMLRLSIDTENDQLVPSEGYAGMFDEQISTMLAELNEMQTQEGQ